MDFGVNQEHRRRALPPLPRQPASGRRSLAELLRRAERSRARAADAGNGTASARRAPTAARWSACRRRRRRAPARAPTARQRQRQRHAPRLVDELDGHRVDDAVDRGPVAAAGCASTTQTCERIPGARHRAGPGLPHARPPLRAPRSARPAASRTRASCRSSASASTEVDPNTRVRHRQLRRPAAAAAARDRRAPEGDLLPHDRRRVHATSKSPRRARWLQERDGVDAATASTLDRDAAAPHPHQADRRRDLRAVPAHEVRRRQALLARGRREHDPAARAAHRGRRRSTASRRSSSAWPTAAA